MQKSGLDEMQSQESNPYWVHHPELLQHMITQVLMSGHILQQLQQLDHDDFVIQVHKQSVCIPVFDDVITILSQPIFPVDFHISWVNQW